MESYIIVLGAVLALILFYLMTRGGGSQAPQDKPTEELLSPGGKEAPSIPVENPVPEVTGQGTAEEVAKATLNEVEANPDEEEASEPVDEPVEESSDLSELSGIGEKYLQLLRASGISTVKALSGLEPEALVARLNEANEREGIVKRTPPLKTVQGWVEQAELYVRY